MERHSAIGERIVAAAPALEAIAPDRALRPRARRRQRAIPTASCSTRSRSASRIIAVVDAFDAMTNDRPYRGAMSTEDALAELRTTRARSSTRRSSRRSRRDRDAAESGSSVLRAALT